MFMYDCETVNIACNKYKGIDDESTIQMSAKLSYYARSFTTAIVPAVLSPLFSLDVPILQPRQVAWPKWPGKQGGGVSS